MATALGAALMSIGAVWEVVDMALAAVASFLVVIILIEVGSPYPWLVWITTSLITFLFFPGKNKSPRAITDTEAERFPWFHSDCSTDILPLIMPNNAGETSRITMSSHALLTGGAFCS